VNLVSSLPLFSKRILPILLAGAAALSSTITGCGSRSSLTIDTEPQARPSPEVVPARFDCRASDSPRPMLAARLGQAIHFVYPDRSSKQVFAFDVPEGMYLSGADVAARGDRVAAYGIVHALGGGKEPPPFAVAAVLDVDGQVLYHERHDFDYEGVGSDSRIYGDARGLFVLTLTEVDTFLGLVLEGSEAHPFSERMAGRGDPDRHGRMVVWDADSNSTATYHFFDTEAGTFTPSRFVADYSAETIASSPAVLGSGIIYLARQPDRIVFEDASGPSDLPLDFGLDLELIYPGFASPAWNYSGETMVFALGGQDELDARYLLTHFASGEVREFRLSPPQGYVLPADYWNPPALDAAGRLLLTLRADDHVRLFATADGAAWEPVGRPIAASPYGTRTQVVNRTVVFQGQGDGEDVPGLLPAWASQLVGPGGGDGIELARWELGAPDNPIYADDEISADGSCLAYFRKGSLHVVEVEGYVSSDLGLPANGYSAEMAWIPLPE
jgi:hypothetical protein